MSATEYEMGYEDGLGDAETRLSRASEQLEGAVKEFAKVSPTKVTSPLSKTDKLTLKYVEIMNWVMAIPYTIYQGFVCSMLWGWFAVPLGAPHISILNFMGLCLLTPMLLLTFTISLVKEKTEQEKLVYEITKLIGFPLIYSFCLLFGFIYSVI